MKNIFKDGNWGLKLLALVLAVVIYHTLKTGSSGSSRENNENDRTFFQSR